MSDEKLIVCKIKNGGYIRLGYNGGYTVASCISRASHYPHIDAARSHAEKALKYLEDSELFDDNVWLKIIEISEVEVNLLGVIEEVKCERFD